MPGAGLVAIDIDVTFSGAITKEANSGWQCVVMPGSGEFFGTRQPVTVEGTVDGHPFQATMLPIGDGTHMVPLKASLRKLLGKAFGDEVEVHLTQQIRKNPTHQGRST